MAELTFNQDALRQLTHKISEIRGLTQADIDLLLAIFAAAASSSRPAAGEQPATLAKAVVRPGEADLPVGPALPAGPATPDGEGGQDAAGGSGAAEAAGAIAQDAGDGGGDAGGDEDDEDRRQRRALQEQLLNAYIPGNTFGTTVGICQFWKIGPGEPIGPCE